MQVHVPGKNQYAPWLASILTPAPDPGGECQHREPTRRRAHCYSRTPADACLSGADLRPAIGEAPQAAGDLLCAAPFAFGASFRARKEKGPMEQSAHSQRMEQFLEARRAHGERISLSRPGCSE